jgi:hypothetical protein
MAKRINTKNRHDSGREITTPSFFGSHRVMVVDPLNYVFASNRENTVSLESGQVLCKDDVGFYITCEKRLDSGLADPNRYSGVRPDLIEKPNEYQAGEIIDPYPPVVDACIACGCFKPIVYISGEPICDSCLKETENDSLHFN